MTMTPETQDDDAAIAMARLLDKARGIVERSTSEGAKDFDTARWLAEWVERPQPALQGRRPSELLKTPAGADAVARVVGAIESGVYL